MTAPHPIPEQPDGWSIDGRPPPGVPQALRDGGAVPARGWRIPSAAGLLVCHAAVARLLRSRHPLLAALLLLSLLATASLLAAGVLLKEEFRAAGTAALLALSAALAVAIGRLLHERQRLSRSRHELDLILNNTGLGLVYKDGDNRVLRLNETAARFLGVTVAGATGRSGYDLFPDFARRRHEEALEAIRSGRPRLGEIKEMGSRHGAGIWGRADKIPYKDPVTGEDRILIVATDLTEQINTERALRRSEERYELAIEMSSIGTWDYDVRTGALYWSPRMKEIAGLGPEAVVARLADFEDRLHPDDRERVRAARDAHLRDRVPYAIEFRMRHETGRYVWIRTRGQAVWDEAGDPVRMAGSIEDITERVELQAQLTHLAHHDALTGFCNRVLLCEIMKEAVERTRHGESFALLCVDLDGFKSVNDTLGHTAGDKLLACVADRLRRCLGETDVVGRLGGDEFAVIRRSPGPRQSAGALAAHIIEEVSAIREIEDMPTVVGASVGIALAPANGTDVERLLSRADLALACAKEEGRGIYRFFEPEMEATIADRRALAVDLRQALAKHELELHYQPLINLERDEISGFEALIRWHHPGRGLVPPGEFIPIAEEAGLINQIGEWVLVEACTEAATWPKDLKVAVNVSPAQFRGGMVMLSVAQALARSGIHASRLELELTESVLLEDDEDALSCLKELHAFGVRISLDDFGTGYSSLSYLRRLPLDKIKIDASFINALSEEADLGIVQAIVGLAVRLGVATTAEGVETEEQLRAVKAEGCTEVQGYLFSPPRPAHEIARLFLQHADPSRPAASGRGRA